MRRVALWLALWIAACTPGLSAAELVVNRPAQEAEVSRPFLRGMFGMRVRAWPDGTPVRVFVLPDTDPTHVAFCTEILQVYPYQLRQNWDRLVYSGTGQPPIEVASEEELIKRVAQTPGAIGYVSATPAAGLATPLKVLHVR